MKAHRDITIMLSALAAALLGACDTEDLAMSPGGNPEAEDDAGAPTLDEAFAEDDTLENLYIHVVPREDDGSMLLGLPKTFGPFPLGDHVELAIPAAQPFTGTITSERVLTWSGVTVPTEELPAEGNLDLLHVETGRLFTYPVDALGGFEALVPEGAYELVARPRSASLTMARSMFQIGADDHLEWHTGLGRPIWGRILDVDGEPLGGVEVYASTPSGSRGPTATTDDLGWYQLRAADMDTFQLTVVGEAGRRLPDLMLHDVHLGAEGQRLDVHYPPTDLIDLSLTLRDPGGKNAANVLVQIRATRLDGYDNEQVSSRYTEELRTDSRGTIFTRVPAGSYTVEVLMEHDDPRGTPEPFALDLSEDTDAPVVRIPAMTTLEFFVADPAGLPTPRVVMQCTELWGNRRTWSTTSAADGLVLLDVPDQPLHCRLTPPPELGYATRSFYLVDEPLPEVVQLRDGFPLTGEARVVRGSASTPVSYGMVQVMDADGTILAVTSTNADGYFEVSLLPFMPSGSTSDTGAP